MEKETPAQWVRMRNGVAHSSALRAAGFTEHSVRAAVDKGELQRVRRSWLVTPGCDSRRVVAASVGGRPTCVTAASLIGLWDVEADAVHVALSSSASRFDRSGVKVHAARGPVPVRPRAAEEPMLNVLFQVARCLPPDAAFAIWESAVRRDFVELDLLERIQWRSTAADELARGVGARSDSGKESTFVCLMRAVGVAVKQQVWVDGHPLDGLIGERLGIQIDGFRHHSSPADRRRDIRADARLALRGYTILRFDQVQVDHDATYVQQSVLTAIAQGLHLARPN